MASSNFRAFEKIAFRTKGPPCFIGFGQLQNMYRKTLQTPYSLYRFRCPQCARDTPHPISLETSQMCTIQRKHYAITKGLCTCKQGVCTFKKVCKKAKLGVVLRAHWGARSYRLHKNAKIHPFIQIRFAKTSQANPDDKQSETPASKEKGNKLGPQASAIQRQDLRLYSKASPQPQPTSYCTKRLLRNERAF